MFPTRQAGTGTWLGPAPRGAANPEQAAAAAAKAAAAVREPSTVLLSTGLHMPLIGLGTYKLQSAGAVKTALELGYRHFDCECVFIAPSQPHASHLQKNPGVAHLDAHHTPCQQQPMGVIRSRP